MRLVSLLAVAVAVAVVAAVGVGVSVAEDRGATVTDDPSDATNVTPAEEPSQYDGSVVASVARAVTGPPPWAGFRSAPRDERVNDSELEDAGVENVSEVDQPAGLGGAVVSAIASATRGPPPWAGPPEHARNATDGNETGPPEHAGPHDNMTEERGPPEDAGSGSNVTDGTLPEHAGPEDNRGPPEHAGPPDNMTEERGPSHDVPRGPR